MLLNLFLYCPFIFINKITIYSLVQKKQLRIQYQQFNAHMGKKIENYCLEQVIGEGEFGKVYRAVNEKTDQVVAIKVIRIEKFKMSPKLEEFTINEIQTLSKIEDTTHIVKFIEILKTANNYYFVYEFCNGGTLEQEIKQSGHFSENKSLAYFGDLLKAFKMLIKRNIMHRDVKPSNILLNNGILKLADFGFCKPLKDSRDLAQTMLGSPIYMAPEVLKGQIYTMKADIWSLGVVLYEMLYGFCPFEERTIARLINLIEESHSITFPPEIQISKKTEELIRKMLVKDQFKRISWEELFQYDLSLNQRQKSDKSPFKKKQFNSITTNYDSVKQTVKLEYVNNYNTNNPQVQKTKVPLFRKAESQNSLVEKYITPLIDKRQLIKKGIKLVENLLCNNNSKLTVHICCFVMKKVKEMNIELGQSVRTVQSEKQNGFSAEIRRVFEMLEDEKGKLEEKIYPFEEQMQNIAEPKDIVYMRYAEEEGLTQEKEGLQQLLSIDDYLNGTNTQYSKLTKKQLLEEYQKRILRKN